MKRSRVFSPPRTGGGEQHDRAGFEQPIDFGHGKVGFFIGYQKMPLLTELENPFLIGCNRDVAPKAWRTLLLQRT
jgi:hypothetical protein